MSAQSIINSSENGRSVVQDFYLPDEVLSVIPTDPYEQLDLARKITSMAIASRVTNLESELGKLRQKLYDKDQVIVDLENKVSELQQVYEEANLRLQITRDENVGFKRSDNLFVISYDNLLFCFP